MVVEYNLTIWIQRLMSLRLAVDILLDQRRRVNGNKQRRSQSIKAEAMKDVCSIYPQCTRCQCHFKTALGRERHKCKGPPMQCSGVSMAVHYANEVLSTRDFTVDGQARAMITSITNPGTSTYASFEVNFIAGWAHCQKNQHPELSTRVQDFIAQCWRTGEESIVQGSAVKSHLKVSAEAVQAKLASQYTDGLLLLSEVPVVSQIRAVYQKIGQCKHPEHELRKRSRIIRNGSLRTKRSKVTLQMDEIDWAAVDLSHLKLTQLRYYLKEHHLKTSGIKKDLIKRIKHFQMLGH